MPNHQNNETCFFDSRVRGIRENMRMAMLINSNDDKIHIAAYRKQPIKKIMDIMVFNLKNKALSIKCVSNQCSVDSSYPEPYRKST